MSQQVAPTAGFLCVGSEILAGEVQDINTRHIASQLVKNGIRLQETRIVPDDVGVIASAVNEMRNKYNYLFVSGGIGPTHDDVTSAAVAKAFGVKLVLDSKSRDMIASYYNVEFEDIRMKMAYIPSGASTILSSTHQPFGFVIQDVYVMTGAPSVFKVVLSNAIKNTKGGPVLLSNSMSFNIPEGAIARTLEEISKVYSSVEIGSYPFLRMKIKGTDVVIRSTSSELVDKVSAIIDQKVSAIIESMNRPPSA